MLQSLRKKKNNMSEKSYIYRPGKGIYLQKLALVLTIQMKQ